MKEIKHIPPRWATKLLSWYCRPELLEDLEGDLMEYFQRHVETFGERKARLIYVANVLKFFRPYTVRRPAIINPLIQWIMIKSYITTSGRSLMRNKLFSFINIAGLAISMSVGLLMITMLHDILMYDQFHENHQRIYRVVSQYQYLDNKDDDFMATTSLKAGNAIAETFAVPEAVAIFRREFGGDVKVGDKTIPLRGMFANDDVFKTFSFELLSGDPTTALRDPFSVVLTQTSAQKLFDDGDALDKEIVLDDRQYTITGVMKDLPVFSHIRFDMLCALSTRAITQKDNKNELVWDNVWDTWVYLLLPPDADRAAIKTSLDQLSEREDKTVQHTHINLELQAMDDIMLGEDMGNQIGPVLGPSVLWIFGGLSAVVILSACFNYTNLSIARALRRTREVGIRKVVGALKRQVVSQFLVEAVIISISSLLLALLLFWLIKPYFLSIKDDIQRIFQLDLTLTVGLAFVAFAVVIGIMAGALPALFFSRVNAIQVLRNTPLSKGFRKLTLRKALIVFQYCISIVLITATVIVYRQYRHFVAFDLGFKTENIFNIDLQGNKPDVLRQVLAQIPEVTGISQSTIVTSIGNYWGTTMKYYANPDDSAGVYYNMVDENYIPLHEHELIAGRNFTVKPDSAAENEVIVDQRVLKRFNIADQDPQKAIGEIVRVDRKDMQIIGVMKNFHYGHATNKTAPEAILRYKPSEAKYLNIKIQSTDLLSTYAKLEGIWKKVDPVHSFNGKFYSEQLEDAFDGLRASVKVAGFLAFLAICIASMGLLGMVVFTTETRMREISIRKVLGATEGGLLFLLGKGFFLLLVLSSLIALPATYIFFQQVAFPEMANHAPIAPGDMVIGLVSILFIAAIMIGTQTLKAARCNPAQVLKNE
jgi:ABC-type antimicrobial peptide transport system permease subunit